MTPPTTPAKGVQLILASASPRRRELLDQLGVRYETIVSKLTEIPLPNENAERYVNRIASEKSRAVLELINTSLPVLAADTEVVLDGKIFGKPVNQAHAIEMLSDLSGCEHAVLTAISLRRGNEHWRALCTTLVRFRDLSENEIIEYCRTGESSDKAGAYAIQGLGGIFVANISGSYSGVMGLPLYETAELLRKVGLHPLNSMARVRGLE